MSIYSSRSIYLLIKEEIKLLQEFEEALFEISKKVEFKRWGNDLQNQMRIDLKHIKREGRVVVKGDKIRNYYSVTPEYYDKVLNKNTKSRVRRGG